MMYVESIEDLKEAAAWWLDGRHSSYDPLDDRHRVGTLLLAGALIRHSVDDLTAWTRYERSFVEAVARRLRAAGVWPDERTTTALWTNPSLVGAAFCFAADVQVGLGRGTRSTNAERWPVYSLDPAAENAAIETLRQFE
jgi:hypothetical protein